MRALAENREEGRRPGCVSRGRVRRLRLMKRLVLWAVSLYLLFAVIGRFAESIGAARCGCDRSCWCKKPALSTFRWVFPFEHRAPAEQVDTVSGCER